MIRPTFRMSVSLSQLSTADFKKSPFAISCERYASLSRTESTTLRVLETYYCTLVHDLEKQIRSEGGQVLKKSRRRKRELLRGPPRGWRYIDRFRAERHLQRSWAFWKSEGDTAFALRVQLCQLLLRLTLLAKDGHFDRAFELEIGHFRCVDWYF